MAYLNKPKKIARNRTSLDRLFYNTSAWHNCRINYLKDNNLCEICKENNVIKLASDVHHIVYLSSVDSLNEKFAIGLDYNNLKALCKECHQNIHKNNK